MLRRAGLLDHAGYLRLLTKTINQVLQTPGRQVQSVAQASFDAWVKYYRQDENTPNATISYYTKGALVALCLDLALRREGRSTLDDVMRQMAEADIAVVTRFHNLVAALHVGRPAISLGYAEKNHALLMDMGLGDFSQDVEIFDLERLKAQTETMIAQRAAHRAAILQHVADYRAQLARQEDLLASRFAIA